MSYFILPNNNNNIMHNDLNLILNITPIKDPYISNTLNSYLTTNKSKIEQVQSEWDNIKKYVNPYEFIHTQIPQCKTSIAKYNPISRSYFKFIEITSLLLLLEPFKDINISSFHLCEGPGGFIESLANTRSNINDYYYGMTLESTNSNIPGWNKSYEILQKHPNIIIEKGVNNTGNILNPANFEYCYSKYKNSMNIITADGGFDFSIDFNMQEILSTRLILAEVLYALVMQKKGGNFILKIFDSFSNTTVEIIYLLTCFYNKVYIIKPNTSRYANSEKYVVCIDFKYHTINHLFNSFFNIIKRISNNNVYIDNILTFQLPYLFSLRLEEINAVLGQQQIESIVNTLNLIKHKNKNDKLEQLKLNNINKCINWCIRYKQPYYKNIQHTNIFQTAT